MPAARPPRSGRGRAPRRLLPDKTRGRPLQPSPLPWGEGWHVPREATEADLDRVREAFVASAKRALRIGFDEIELHMAHGYLLHGFMSPISNKRTDHYGGSFENRMRFPLSVARAVRAVVPKHIPLGARITGSDWREDGLTPDDAVAIARALKGEGLDFICVSSGGALAEIRTPTTPGYNVPIAERVKKEAGIATRTVGMIVKPEQAEEIVAKGQGRHGVDGARLSRRSALGLACGQGARRRRGAAAAIPARRSQTVGAGCCAGVTPRAAWTISYSSPSCSPPLCHAGWNALIKVGLDPLSTTTLISIGSAVVAMLLLPFAGIPAAASWPWLVASVIIHLFYFAALIESYRTGDLGQVYPIARGSAPLMTAAASDDLRRRKT